MDGPGGWFAWQVASARELSTYGTFEHAEPDAPRLRTRVGGGCSAVDAVFLHVLFANDLSHKPASATLLLARARQVRTALGVRLDRVHDWAATIVLPAGL